jgi:hypothetical protein
VTRILESGWRCPFKRRKCFFAFILNMMTCKVVGKVHVVRKVSCGRLIALFGCFVASAARQKPDWSLNRLV